MNIMLRFAAAALAAADIDKCGRRARARPGPVPRDAAGRCPPGGRGGRFGGMPPRDNVPAPTGTAKISGRVVAADTGSPIRRAQINVNSRDAQFNRSVTTDSEGRYELARFRPDAIACSSTRPDTWRSSTDRRGRSRPASRSTSPTVRCSRRSTSACRAAARSPAASPTSSATRSQTCRSQALRYQFVNGERQLVNAGRSAQTDDLGAYRIFGLMPGDYVVRASMRREHAAAAREPPMSSQSDIRERTIPACPTSARRRR